ncbi:MAG: helicase HerA domain-containing protein [Haloferacaceae archaeon]
MSDSESITVADVSAGPGGTDADPGTPVDLPVVELLTGRGLITGKSGSGKSNTASVIIENLLANGFPVLVVDTDGEYYGLKEEFELLHAGADDECDIRVTPEHAGKLAELALEGNVPIILDVSGYLDEDVAAELVRETARHLFAKEKKLKKPFLMLVEECHEYVPEGGGLDETGRMLVKVGKRGRKHGLGIVGISQRPANVKKDFITQCDWLVWHRLTWENDTKVVRRIIDGEHADAVEDLDDGEAFLMTDRSDSVRRVQFRRKRTFDAGATPGLDDVERPDLKSVSDDLVDELREISAERERRESELADLRTELEEREARIRELERELEQAKDLERMADRFSQALLRRAEAPYRDVDFGESGAEDDGGDPGGRTAGGGDGVDADAGDGSLSDRSPLADVDPWPDPAAAGAENGSASASAGSDGRTGDSRATTGSEGRDDGRPDAHGADRSGDVVADTEADDVVADTEADDGRDAGVAGESAGGERGDGDHHAPADGDEVRTASGEASTWPFADGDDPSSAEREAVGTRRRTRDALIDDLIDRIQALGDVTREMLRYYRAEGPAEPVDAHLAAGGDADREVAYSRTRTLRTAGLVCHAERGTYDYDLPALVDEEGSDRLRDPALDEVVRAVEASFVGPVDGSDDSDERAPSAVDEDEAEDVEFVRDEGAGAENPAFREEDAEFVDEAELVDDGERRAGAERDGAGAAANESSDPGASGEETGDAEAVVMEETTSPSDGLIDRSEEPRDAEFVD